MDELESARRMGREGQQALGLSVQEQGAYDQGRRERAKAAEAFQPAPGGAGGGGAIAVLVMLAPAMAAPGLLVMATWTYITQDLGWAWFLALGICGVEVIGLIWLAALFYRATPAVVAAIVTSIYLGVSYAICAPLFFSAGIAWTALLGVGAGALGYLAGLAAPNKWMSSRLVTSIAAIAAAIALIVVVEPIALSGGFPLWAVLALRCAGVGMILGVALHTMFWTKWTFFGFAAVIALVIWQAPGLIEQLVQIALGSGPGLQF
jgi:hypothetical protein